MEQINLGSLPDGTGGDSIRVGFQKCNDNFTEVAEQLKTAGGGASAAELKQIKDTTTALAERVGKLEEAGAGGGAPAGELEELKQQLQQLQTNLTAAEQAAGGAAGQAEAATRAARAAQQAAAAAHDEASGATQTADAAKQEAAAAKSSADTLDGTVAELKKSVAQAGAGDGVFVGKIELLSTTADALPAKWYLATGDKYAENSPQGQALKALPESYKRAFKIELKNGQINTPNLFHTDGRGYFLRSSKNLGEVQGDAIRNITGTLDSGDAGNMQLFEGIENDGVGALYVSRKKWKAWIPDNGGGADGRPAAVSFDASRVVPTADENRPLNIGFLPAIYLGV